MARTSIGPETPKAIAKADAPRFARAAAYLAVAASGLAGPGCASSVPLSPAAVTRAQIAALRAGDEAGARALLSPEVRTKAPQWPAPADLPTSESVVETERSAIWTDPNAGFGHELELVRTENGWSIRRGVLALFRLDTAEGALAAFARALEADDPGLVLALMPDESRRLQVPGGFEKVFRARAVAWRELGKAISAGHVSWLPKSADRAEVLVMVGEPPAERRVTLVRDEGGWKVFDVQPWSEYIAP